MNKLCTFVIAASFCSHLLLTANALAATLSTTGDVNLIPPPPDVTMDALESDTDMWIFDEVQGLLLTDNLSVNFGGSGGVISAGTMINSHFLHKDTFNTSGRVTLSGSATFDGEILGIIASATFLNTSDPILGLAGTSYPTGLVQRGTQIGEEQDSITFSGNTVTVTSLSDTWPDQLRVITAVPVPAAVWLFGSGLLGLIGISRRKKAANSA